VYSGKSYDYFLPVFRQKTTNKPQSYLITVLILCFLLSCPYNARDSLQPLSDYIRRVDNHFHHSVLDKKHICFPKRTLSEFAGAVVIPAAQISAPFAFPPSWPSEQNTAGAGIYGVAFKFSGKNRFTVGIKDTAGHWHFENRTTMLPAVCYIHSIYILPYTPNDCKQYLADLDNNLADSGNSAGIHKDGEYSVEWPYNNHQNGINRIQPC